MKQKLIQKTKKEVVADRFTTNVEIEFGGDFFPRPLLVSGSPFLPPLSKRASLLKIRLSGPPGEAPKILCGNGSTSAGRAAKRDVRHRRSATLSTPTKGRGAIVKGSQ